jgi:hypothetical protein
MDRRYQPREGVDERSVRGYARPGNHLCPMTSTMRLKTGAALLIVTISYCVVELIVASRWSAPHKYLGIRRAR